MQHTIEEVRLKNGARGLLIDVPDARVFDMRFGFRAGNRFVKNKAKYETAHLMEHMAFGANIRFKDEHDYEAEFTKNGAYHNAYTSDFAMSYIANCADFEWERILDLQSLAITSPKFNEEEMQSEKGNITNELTGYKNNYGRLIWSYMQKDLGEDILLLDDELKTLPNIKLKDVRDFHNYTHTLANMRFIIAGNLRTKKTKLVQVLEGFDLERGARLAMPRDEYHSAPARLIQRKDAANLSFGWTMILDRHLDYEGALLMESLNHILTGTLYSRILGRARREGLVYGVFSEASTGEFASAWDFGGEVNYEAAGELFAIMAEEINKVADGDIKDSEVEACKSYALGRYLMSGQTVGSLAGSYASLYFNLDEINLRSEMPERIKKLNKEDMVRAANQFIDNQKWTLTMVGNKDFVDTKGLSNILSEVFA